MYDLRKRVISAFDAGEELDKFLIKAERQLIEKGDEGAIYIIRFQFIDFCTEVRSALKFEDKLYEEFVQLLPVGEHVKVLLRKLVASSKLLD